MTPTRLSPHRSPDDSLNLYGYATMNIADELSAWYDLRDRLRSNFIRGADDERPPFSPRRQRLLDHVDDVIARMERLKRSALNGPSAPDTLQSTNTPTVTPREDTR